MRHAELSAGTEYVVSGKPDYVSHYRTDRVRVLSTDRWREHDYRYSYGSRNSTVKLGDQEHSVRGVRDDKGQHVLVQKTAGNGAGSVYLVHSSQIRAPWSVAGPLIDRHQLEKADADREAREAARAHRELVDGIVERAEHLLGREVSIHRSGNQSVVMHAGTLAELLALIPVETP